MARIKVNGTEVRVIRPESAQVGSMAELQYQSGWKLKQLQDRLQYESYATAVVVFLSLWEAGQRPSWDDCLAMPVDGSGIDWIEEPADDIAEDVEEKVDPTPAPTGSARGGARGKGPATSSGRRSPSKTTGSTRKSSAT